MNINKLVVGGILLLLVAIITIVVLGSDDVGSSYNRQVCSNDVRHGLVYKMAKTKVDVVSRGKLTAFSCYKESLL